jgi:hypothetical protein
MLHLIYIIAFTCIAFLAIGNLIRNLISLSTADRNMYRSHPKNSSPSQSRNNLYTRGATPHPELLDDNGKIINEPLLVMRSISVEDARQQLDALYNSSPSNKTTENES